MDAHAYAVTAYNASNNTFTLYNPWGFDQPPAGLTWAQLMATTDIFTVASTSGSLPISSTPVKSGIVPAGAAPAWLAAAAPDALFAAIAGQSPSESGPPPIALAAADSAATGGSSSLAAASAARRSVRAIWDRLRDVNVHPAPWRRPNSVRLTAFSVDELFRVSSGVAVANFA